MGNVSYEEEKYIECLVGKPEIKRQLQGVRLGKEIIMKKNLEKRGRSVCTKLTDDFHKICIVYKPCFLFWWSWVQIIFLKSGIMTVFCK